MTTGPVRNGCPDVWAAASEHFAAWRTGDPVAFNRLVRLLTPVLWQVVRAYRLDTALAEDVVQETWLALVRNPCQVRDPSAVGGWLLTTARRRAWRTAARYRERPDDDRVRDVVGASPSAEEMALARHDDRTLWYALAALSERCRLLLRIVAFSDRPGYGRVAEQLGMPLGSIGPTRRRCLEKLRAQLGGDHV